MATNSTTPTPAASLRPKRKCQTLSQCATIYSRSPASAVRTLISLITDNLSVMRPRKMVEKTAVFDEQCSYYELHKQ